MKDYYERIIPVELHDKLKASECAEINLIGRTIAFLMGASAFFGIVWAIVLIAWLIWTVKFTLFIFASTTVVFVFVGAWTIWQIRVYSKNLKQLIETLKKRE